MKSIIHDETVLNKGKKDRTDWEIKKLYAVFQCNKINEGHRQGRQVPQLLLRSQENCQMAECIC